MKLSQIVGGSLVYSLATAACVDLDISIQKTYPVVQVALGTPPVDHKLLFDTGSATLWVIDASCTTQCENGSGANRTSYDVAESSTGFEDHNITDSIEYSGGTVTGIFASDIATVGNLAFRQSFASVIQSTWTSLAADGFLGLASSSIAFPGTTSFFENMMQQCFADEPRFGIYFGSAVSTMANDSPANNGVLTFGASKEAKYSDEDVKFVDVTPPFQVYKVPFQAMNISNTENAADANLAWEGDLVFDTGSALIVVPDDKIEELYNATPWTFQQLMTGTRPLCSDFTDDWSVSFTIGTAAAPQTFSVKGSQLAEPGYQDDDHCFPPFNSWDSQNIILGKLWMSNFYSVFDFGSFDEASYNLRVGLAPLKEKFLPKV